MNWYEIFYWLSVADKVQIFFSWMAGIFTIGTVILLVISIVYESSSDSTPKAIKRWGISFFVFAILSWGGLTFTPSKQDCMLIIAGGSVGNFITSDSSSKAIPSDITKFLHQSLQNEIKGLGENAKRELGLQTPKEKLLDKIKEMTKEELTSYIKSDTTIIK